MFAKVTQAQTEALLREIAYSTVAAELAPV